MQPFNSFDTVTYFVACCFKYFDPQYAAQKYTEMFTYHLSSFIFTLSPSPSSVLFFLSFSLHGSPHAFVNTHSPLLIPTQQSTSSTNSHWLPVTSLVQSVESDSKKLFHWQLMPPCVHTENCSPKNKNTSWIWTLIISCSRQPFTC